MKRRRLLGTVGAGLTMAAAGCASQTTDSGGDGGDSDSDDSGGDATSTRTSTARSSDESGDPNSALRDPDLPLDDSDLSRGAPKDAIPAITDPVFGSDWSGFDASLDDSSQVIGIERDGEARAYPFGIMNWHEIVNDEFNGPVLVTYCPLCGSGVTAERTVRGEETSFGVSGLLWMSDLVMYDTLTESLWSQVLGKAVQGPETGTSLSLLPSTITTWNEWQSDHPDTQVLLPPPESDTVQGEVDRNYDRNPYSGYDESRQIGIGGGGDADDRLHPKAPVIGVTNGGTARAYSFGAVQEAGGVVNDTVEGLPVAVATTDNETLVAYVRRVDGETLEFSRDGDVLRAGDSRWRLVSGEALDGPLEGTRLQRANDRSQMFWFAWADFFPDTEVFGRGS
jgi:hypothetical protein